MEERGTGGFGVVWCGGGASEKRISSDVMRTVFGACRRLGRVRCRLEGTLVSNRMKFPA